MDLVFSARFDQSLQAAPEEVQRAFWKQAAFLLTSLNHPSLRAKKYNSPAGVWQARVNRSWRFYFNPGFLFTALLFTGVVGIPLLLLERRSFPGMDASLIFLAMGLGLIVTGAFLLLQKRTKMRGREEVNWKDGVLTGLLQGLSILPGHLAVRHEHDRPHLEGV